jgi:hypothetical protein
VPPAGRLSRRPQPDASAPDPTALPGLEGDAHARSARLSAAAKPTDTTMTGLPSGRPRHSRAVAVGTSRAGRSARRPARPARVATRSPSANRDPAPCPLWTPEPSGAQPWSSMVIRPGTPATHQAIQMGTAGKAPASSVAGISVARNDGSNSSRVISSVCSNVDRTASISPARRGARGHPVHSGHCERAPVEPLRRPAGLRRRLGQQRGPRVAVQPAGQGDRRRGVRAAVPVGAEPDGRSTR